MSWSGGDWMCGACQHINFKKRDACQSCGYPKFGGPDPSTYRYNRTEALAGDWVCTAINCGAHNYASRSSCYRCGTLKDDYPSGYGGNMAGSGGYGSDCGFPPGWKTGDWICPRSVQFRLSSYFEYWDSISIVGVISSAHGLCNCKHQSPSNLISSLFGPPFEHGSATQILGT